MRHARIALALIFLLAFALALAGCGASGTPSAGTTAELVADERPVPAGMPVMYEFFTTT